jgi:hypothetical protein
MGRLLPTTSALPAIDFMFFFVANVFLFDRFVDETFLT